VFWGAIAHLDIVWNTADAAMGLMAVVNLIGILALSGVVKRVTSDYIAQLKTTDRPVFNIADHAEISRGVDKEIWSLENGHAVMGIDARATT